MHITVCMAILVCVLCQPVHSCIKTSLHQLDFFLKIFLWRLVSALFYKINFFQIVTRCRPPGHALAVDASFAHECTNE